MLIFTSFAPAQSSYVNTYSTVSYDSNTNTVTGYAYTQPSYMNAAYYDAHVNATLYDESGNMLVYSGDFPGGGGQATVNVSSPGTGCGYYQIVASHFQIETYYVYNYYDNGYYYTGYYDPYYYEYFDGGSGSPIWGSFSYFGPGPPTYEYSDHTIFDNTEEWSSGNCNLPPRIDSISPARGGVGGTTNVTINGMGFRTGATIGAMAGITVSNVHVVSAKKITADFAIAGNAAGGNRSVQVTAGGQTSNVANFFVQIPTSLSVVSVTTLPTGTDTSIDGCITPSPGDYGIKVSVKYQVKDQENPAEAITNNVMAAQETITNVTVNGVSQPDPAPNFVDLGPSRITGTSRFTDANGQFYDAPYGVCLNGSFTYGFTQNVRMWINSDSTTFAVRTNNVAVTSLGSGTGSISNGSDIQRSRP